MGALFSRVKTWVSTEDVTFSDLNAEFDNILNNLSAANVDDFSASVSQMQSSTDPGEVGTESLATSIAGEIQRLRFLVREITGEDEWYETPVSSITGLANAIGVSGLTDNRIVSGRILSTSEQPAFLVPNGAARTIKLDGDPTNFIYYVEGTEYTIDSDVTLTNLTAAPSSNNTCLVNDALAADQYWTKYQGEDGTEIPVDTMGTEISALIGKFAAFSINNGSATEYFVAYVKSSTSLTKVRRGYFFDSADAPIPRIVYTNNDVITLMKLTWVFAKDDGTLTVTYNNPVWSLDEPSSPAANDYWFDYAANKWKKYDVASFIDADAVLVGICIQDTSNTVGARSFEFFAAYGSNNSIELLAESNTEIRSRYPGGSLNVWGNAINNEHNIHIWDITADLESGVSESASTYYYVYLTEDGDTLISDKKPYDRRGDLGGYYHPHQSWRAVGRFFNDASSNISEIESYYRHIPAERVRSVIAADRIQPLDGVNVLSGASAATQLPDAALVKGQTYRFVHNGTSLTQVYTITPFGAQTIGGYSTYPLYTAKEWVDLKSIGTGWLVSNHFAQTDWASAGTITIHATTTNPTKGDTQTHDIIRWRRSGTDAHIRMNFRQTSSTGSAAGTGDYIFLVTAIGSIDTTKVDVYATVEGWNSSYQNAFTVGNAQFGNGTNMADGAVVVYDASYVRIFAIDSVPNAGALASTGYPLTGANIFYSLNFVVPMANWRP